MSEPPAQGGEWRPLADEIAAHVKDFVDGVDALARDGGDETVPMLLLEVSQVLLAGAQLGASKDVILPGNWEPAVSADPDLDALYRHDTKSYALIVLNIARELSRRLRVADGLRWRSVHDRDAVLHRPRARGGRRRANDDQARARQLYRQNIHRVEVPTGRRIRRHADQR